MTGTTTATLPGDRAPRTDERRRNPPGKEHEEKTAFSEAAERASRSVPIDNPHRRGSAWLGIKLSGSLQQELALSYGFNMRLL